MRLFSVRRTLISLAAGVAAGMIAWLAGAASLAPTAGWTAGTTVLLVWVWWISWPQDPAGTKRLAEHEGSAFSMDGFVLAGAAAGLAAVVNVLVRASTPAAVILAVLAAILSWALVNTVYAFKYARLYYVDEDGGMDFKQPEPPSYSDFAYLAFTVGASFAVSDTDIKNSAIRRVVLSHALLSYAFGTITIAVAINLVTNLGR